MSIPLKIAIQGGPASFHDLVAQQYFSGQNMGIIPCMTFQRVCAAVQSRAADFGVMAIENAVAGSILGNYSLLQDYPVSIIGETYLPIEQNLLALPGQTLADIKLVRSHPMALLQCTNFLEENPHIQALESADTAESAREIRENNLTGVGAIASKLAAERYQLEIVEERVENYKENYTRFIIIARKPLADKSRANKASVIFTLHHRAGTLAGVLDCFRDLNLNLSLIQSIPILSHPSEFAILVDLEWEEYATFEQAIENTTPLIVDLKILGIYQRGSK